MINAFSKTLESLRAARALTDELDQMVEAAMSSEDPEPAVAVAQRLEELAGQKERSVITNLLTHGTAEQLLLVAAGFRVLARDRGGAHE